ncbi:MAG: riboflavin synthase [Candidatus Taylorbacteria bacterium]|nr:riboflavin synthase [Candidatus Taylorbacteria bacterium]
MFTGIIRKTTKVNSPVAQGATGLFEVINPKLRVKSGDSVTVNGVCSTIVKGGKTLLFQYMPETLERTTICNIKLGEMVNLEESLRLSDRLDGHIVLGHVDTVGEIVEIKAEGNSKIFEIEPREPKRFMKFIAEKGSITLDGVSLTVVNFGAKYFTVKLIPYTLEHTAFGEKSVGGKVNIEFDILAKYLERLK